MFPFPFVFWDVKFLSPVKNRMILPRPALALPLLWQCVCSYWGPQRTYMCSAFAGWLPTHPLSTSQPPTPRSLVPCMWPCLCSLSALALGWNGINDICCLPACLTQLQDVSLCPFVSKLVHATAAVFSHPYWEKTTVFPVGIAPLLWIKGNMLRLWKPF